MLWLAFSGIMARASGARGVEGAETAEAERVGRTRFLGRPLVHVPIQCIQTDRGAEFTGYQFQDVLAERHTKWRPIKPHKPHLNGKVERMQQTVLDEFYATIPRS